MRFECECVDSCIGLSVGRLAAPITEGSRVQTSAAVSRGGERDNAHQGQESSLLSFCVIANHRKDGVNVREKH